MTHRITRREALRRATLLAAASGAPFSFTAASANTAEAQSGGAATKGYGTDPDLIHPSAPWPNTLSQAQLELVEALADILIPTEQQHPSASEVGVVEVLDEWVSAPYPVQQDHRRILLEGFAWLDQTCRTRFSTNFAKIAVSEQMEIVDAIAYPDRAAPDHQPAAEFFGLFRRLVAGMYYSSPEGTRELGYQGNVPIAGDYPGPSKAAHAHLAKILNDLGLDPV